MKTEDIIDIARQTITEEAAAGAKLTDYIDDDFTQAVNYILHSKGRVVITGIGKSAIIANKIVATMNSTGTPAIFMHAADAIHGDLGIIQQEDVVICISKSGNTPEIKVLVPLLKRGNNKLIAITSNRNSVLAQQADSVLYDNQLRPRMIIEYKAPTIPLTQKVFEQISVYNLLLHVDYLIISNGLDTYICKMDYENQRYAFLETIPDYQNI